VANFTRGKGPLRQFIWSDILTRLAAVSISGKIASGLGALGVATAGGITLIRTRGRVLYHFDPANISDVVMVALGLGIFSSDAFAAGAVSMPGPITDADYDWVWHNAIVFGPSFEAAESNTSIVGNVNIEVDSKAMRKMKPSQTLGWIAEVSIISGGGTVDLSVVARHLFKI